MLLFGRGPVCFFAVWAGGVLVFFFCVWAGGVFIFLAVWAGEGSSLTYRSAWLVFKGPNNKKYQTAKKQKHGFLHNGMVNPPYSKVRVFLFLLSGLFCCLGFSGVVIFSVWAGAYLIFCCLGGGRVLFFAVRAGGVFFFCCLDGDGSSLTYRPGWLGSKGLTTKKTKQQKQHGFLIVMAPSYVVKETFKNLQQSFVKG